MDESKIPPGDYCYVKLEQIEGTPRLRCLGMCPYWSRRDDRPEQENGYCSYLGWGDWEQDNFSLLWDQVKECGINTRLR